MDLGAFARYSVQVGVQVSKFYDEDPSDGKEI